MTDIVDRLKGFGWPLTEEAAKEIEDLRIKLNASVLLNPVEYHLLKRDADLYKALQEKQSAEYSQGILG